MIPIRARAALYRGVWFRSRLEACWARFFDNHEIEWEYEEHAFDLDGINYLPGFFLPRIKTWFEAKGRMEPRDALKIQRLAQTVIPRGDLVLVGGAPAGAVMAFATEFGELNFEAEWVHCVKCGKWSVSLARCRACGHFDPLSTLDGLLTVFDAVMVPEAVTWGGDRPAERWDVPAEWISDGISVLRGNG